MIRRVGLSDFKLIGVLNVTPDSFFGRRRSSPTRRRGRRAPCLTSWRPRAPRSWTSAARAPAPAPRRSTPRPRSHARTVPVIERPSRAAGRAASRSTRRQPDRGRRGAGGAGAALRQRRHARFAHGRRCPHRRRRRAPTAASTHMRGDPVTMQVDPRYDDVVGEVMAAPADGAGDRALAAGILESRIWLDPGIGFGKTPPQSGAAQRTRQDRRAGPTRRDRCQPQVVHHHRRRDRRERRRGRGPPARLARRQHSRPAARRQRLRVHDVAETGQALAVAAAVGAASAAGWPPNRDERQDPATR